jgi:hypothetical protein
MIKSKYIYLGLSVLCLQSMTAFADPNTPTLILKVTNRTLVPFTTTGAISYTGAVTTQTGTLANPLNYNQTTTIQFSTTSNAIGDFFSKQFTYGTTNSSNVPIGCTFWAQCIIEKINVNGVTYYNCNPSGSYGTATKLSNGSDNPGCAVDQPYTDSDHNMVINFYINNPS